MMVQKRTQLSRVKTSFDWEVKLGWVTGVVARTMRVCGRPFSVRVLPRSARSWVCESVSESDHRHIVSLRMQNERTAVVCRALSASTPEESELSDRAYHRYVRLRLLFELLCEERPRSAGRDDQINIRLCPARTIHISLKRPMRSQSDDIPASPDIRMDGVRVAVILGGSATAGIGFVR